MATTICIGKPGPGDDGGDPPKIRNFETVASYNWLDEPKPTILVPGVPPIWDPPVIRPVLLPDTGGRHIDQNTESTSGSPLQALICAVQTCQPAFDFTKVSIITDREPVRCLLNFVGAEPVAFEFGVTVVGNTALFARIEKKARVCSPKHSRSREYRDAFEEQYTKISASAARTTSHHRVVKYDFADQTILLHYAADAYLGGIAKTLLQAEGIDDFAPGMLVQRHKDMNVKGDPPSKSPPNYTPVVVIEGGYNIPHAAILELNTRAENSQARDSIERKIPEFWISQTLNYHLAFHHEREEGTARSTIFHRIRLIPMGELLKNWEETNAEQLRALAHLLAQVIRVAIEFGGPCIVSSDGSKGASLEVFRAEGEQVPALPEDMRCLFLPMDGKALDASTEEEDVAMTGTEGVPIQKGSPPARRVSLNANLCTREEVAEGPAQNENIAPKARTVAYNETRKRKLTAKDALEPINLPPTKMRVLQSVFRTPGQAVAVIKEQDPSVEVKDEPVDCEMSM